MLTNSTPVGRKRVAGWLITTEICEPFHALTCRRLACSRLIEHTSLGSSGCRIGLADEPLNALCVVATSDQTRSAPGAIAPDGLNGKREPPERNDYAAGFHTVGSCGT